MDDLLGVGVVQPGGYLLEDVQGLVQGQPALHVQGLVQGSAVHVFENEIDLPVLLEDGVDLDQVRMARGVTKLLREQEKCELVLGMSHLGYYANPQRNEVGDTQVAAQVDGIDFIASGPTHTFMEKPVLQKTPSGNDTVIFQVGRSGIYVGRVDFTLRDGKVTAYAGRLLDLQDESLA